MKKVFATLGVIMVFLFSILGCTDDKNKVVGTEEMPEELDYTVSTLVGVWRSEVCSNEYRGCLRDEIRVITDRITQVHLNTDNGRDEGIAWYGTFEDLQEPADEYVFESQELREGYVGFCKFYYENGLLYVEGYSYIHKIGFRRVTE